MGFLLKVVVLALLGLCNGLNTDRFSIPIKPVIDTGKLPESFYDLCKEDVPNCIGAYDKGVEGSELCIENKNCTAIAGFEKIENQFVFYAMALDKEYVAFGFSNKAGMGEMDPVVECALPIPNSTLPELHLSLNKGHSNTRLESKANVTLQNASNRNDLIYCQFLIPDSVEFNTTVLSLTSDDGYFFILAAGPLKQVAGTNEYVIGRHSARASSEEKWFKSSRDDADDGSAAMAASSALVLLGFVLNRIR